MHAIEGGVNGKKMETSTEKKEEDDDSMRQSPQVPQSQQNGAALPEETAAAAADRLHSSSAERDSPVEDSSNIESRKKTNCESSSSSSSSSLPKQQQTEVKRNFRSEDNRGNRKRKSTEEEVISANGGGSTSSKKICTDQQQREQVLSSLISGYENASAEELASRADVLRAELQALDELARAAEMEWNRVLTMRKLKEEAFLRIERRRQVVNFMEGNEKLSNDLLPTSGLILDTSSSDWDMRKPSRERTSRYSSRDDLGEVFLQESSALCKIERVPKSNSQQALDTSSTSSHIRKQIESFNENRQIGEGRQGPIVDVKSIIADYRLRHPETVPRRGRRMRNSVNVGLGAGGAMVETSQNADSRPSSTDSCKSNSNTDANSSMSFKDVLVQFAKLSQQQGEPVKTPQNYPDVTLHPVAAASPVTSNSSSQQTGSLLHGILTKAQSPKPTTFSPTLARLLTAPERERSAPITTVTPHLSSSAAAHRYLQSYQENNSVSISNLLSSSKARTEITITPVVNTSSSIQPHAKNLKNMLHVDIEEETGMIDDGDSRISSRRNREEREVTPRCQGCHERTALYVCAGCGNQWYCSPECQANAWDEHSEVCSG